MPHTMNSSKGIQQEARQQDAERSQKRPFVAPTLERQERLPEVTFFSF